MSADISAPLSGSDLLRDLCSIVSETLDTSHSSADGVHALNRSDWSSQLSRFKSRITALKKVVNDTQVRTSTHPREAGRLRSFSKTHASDLSQLKAVQNSLKITQRVFDLQSRNLFSIVLGAARRIGEQLNLSVDVQNDSMEVDGATAATVITIAPNVSGNNIFALTLELNSNNSTVDADTRVEFMHDGDADVWIDDNINAEVKADFNRLITAVQNQSLSEVDAAVLCIANKFRRLRRTERLLSRHPILNLYTLEARFLESFRQLATDPSFTARRCLEGPQLIFSRSPRSFVEASFLNQDTENSMTFIGLEPAKACHQLQPQSSVDALDDDDMRTASQLSDFAAVLRFSPAAILPLNFVSQLCGAQPLASHNTQPDRSIFRMLFQSVQPAGDTSSDILRNSVCVQQNGFEFQSSNNTERLDAVAVQFLRIPATNIDTFLQHIQSIRLGALWSQLFTSCFAPGDITLSPESDQKSAESSTTNVVQIDGQWPSLLRFHTQINGSIPLSITIHVEGTQPSVKLECSRKLSCSNEIATQILHRCHCNVPLTLYALLKFINKS